MTWSRFLLALMAAVCTAQAFAAPATVATLDEIRKQTHYSMELTGWIDVDEAGAVSAHGLDQDVAKLPPAVVTLVAQAAAGWRFASNTVGASPATRRSPIRLRVEARRGSDGYITDQRIAGARFGEVPPEERVTFAKKPRGSTTYNDDAYRARASGDVYLVVRVGRDGKPMQVVAQQVNLTVVDTEAGMEKWRRILGDLGVRIAQRWRFTPPSVGPHASRPDWTIQIPVRFHLGDKAPPQLGQWDLFIPGPKHEIPWDTGNDVGIVSGGAGMPDEVDEVGSSLRLLTPLNRAPPS